MADTYLPEIVNPAPDMMGLDKPYWDGLEKGELWVQRCKDCKNWQWGPEWICFKCRSFNLGWEKVEARGRIYSWMRPWHPVHPALKDHGPYLVVLVELPQAGNIRMPGNLLGDPKQTVKIGTEVQGVFERHASAKTPYTLLQWKTK